MLLVETRRLSRLLAHRLLKMRSRRSEIRCVCKKKKKLHKTKKKKKQNQKKKFRLGMLGTKATAPDYCPGKY